MRPTRSRRNTADSARSNETFKTATSDLQEDLPKSSPSASKSKQSSAKLSQTKNAGKASTQSKVNTAQTITRSANPPSRTTVRSIATRKSPNVAATSSRNKETSKTPLTVKKTTKASPAANKSAKTPASATKSGKAPIAKRKREIAEVEDDSILESNMDTDENVRESNIKIVKRRRTSDAQENLLNQSTTSKRKVERKAEEGNPDDDSFWNIEKAFVTSTVRKPTITFGNKTTQQNARSRKLISSTRRGDPSTVDIFANLKPSLIVKPVEKPTPRRASNQAVKGVKPVTEMVINNKISARESKKVKEMNVDSATSKKRTVTKSTNNIASTTSKLKGTSSKAAANTPTSSSATVAAASSSFTTTDTPRNAKNVNPAPAINKSFKDKGKGRADDYDTTTSPTPTMKKPLSLSKSKNKSMATDSLFMTSNVGFGLTQASHVLSPSDTNDQGPSYSSLKKPRFDLLVPSVSSQLGNKPSSGPPSMNKLGSAQTGTDMQDVNDKSSSPNEAAGQAQPSSQLPLSKPELSALDELTAELSIDSFDVRKDDKMPTVPVQSQPSSSPNKSSKASSPIRQNSFDAANLPIRHCTPPSLSPTSEVQKLKFLQSTPTLVSGSREVSAFDIFGNCPLSPIYPINKTAQLSQFDILQSTPIISTSRRTRQLIMTEEIGSPQRIRRLSPPKSPTRAITNLSRNIVDLGDESSLPLVALDIEQVTPPHIGVTEQQKNMRLDDYIMSLADQSIDIVKDHGQKQIEILREKSNQIKDELTQRLMEKYGNDGEHVK